MHNDVFKIVKKKIRNLIDCMTYRNHSKPFSFKYKSYRKQYKSITFIPTMQIFRRTIKEKTSPYFSFVVNTNSKYFNISSGKQSGLYVQ